MQALRYDIICSGEIIADKDPEAVKRDLAKVFKIDAARVEQILSKSPKIVRRNVDRETALKFVALLEEAGVGCRMQAARKHPKIASVQSGEQEVVSAAGDQLERFSCPNCDFEQVRSGECLRCGIIFSKFSGSAAEISRPVAAGKEPVITFRKGVQQPKQIGVLLVLLMVFAFVVYRFWIMSEIAYPAGILVTTVPHQEVIKNSAPWRNGERVFVPMAKFALRARVLGRERYRFDATADIAPVDLVLGWGPMSDQGILDEMMIVQGNRRFFMAPREGAFPLPIPLLMQHCANMHMIPAGNEVKRDLLSLRVGQIIELDGYLVGVREGGHWTWVSSLSRQDTGDGSCEIVWVTQVRTLQDVQPALDITQWDSRRILATRTVASPGSR